MIPFKINNYKQMKGAVKAYIEQEQNVLEFQLFSELSEEELNRLNYDKICKFHKKGTVIYKEGNRLNGFFCILSGIVKVYKIGINGKEQIIRFAKKGDIIGYRSLLSQEVACSAAKVFDDAGLCNIPYKTLEVSR